jgi:hypothetical protein
MFYELYYELIKSVILLIVLHYLFLYLKNLFIEVYEFNPLEISLDKHIKPMNNETIAAVISHETPILNTTISGDINDNNINNNIKDELLNFINNEYNNDIETATTDVFSECPSNIN